MRKNIIFSMLLAVCVVVLSFANVKTDVSVAATAEVKNNEVITVAKTNVVDDEILKSRFLNMLNHNFVYDDDFYSDASIVENSTLALLALAEDSLLNQTYLSDYVFNMYGKVYKDYSFLDQTLTETDGFIYIMPRGYSIYTHKNPVITANDDDSFTVVTDLEISLDNGEIETAKATTLILKNSESAFGYNIMYSDINELFVSGADC